MGEILNRINTAVQNYRAGDRIVMDNGFSLNSSVYRKSKQQNPYFSFGFDGRFKITLLEVLLITVAVSVIMTLCLLKFCHKVGNFFDFSGKKKAKK